MRVGLTSVLEEIPGIGPGKRRALLRELGSLRGVREAPLERLREVRGLSARDAETIRRFFDGFVEPPAAESDVETEAASGVEPAPEPAGEAEPATDPSPSAE
jgi:excinuclease ABC subunit C